MDPSGRTALVTGGARRVGAAIARSLARRGARLVIHYRASSEDAARLADEIVAAGGQAATLRADLGAPDQVERLAEAAWDLGPVDILVNNAAVYHRTPLERLSAADWDLHVDVNLKAPFLLSTLLGRRMAAAGAGAIVNIADWAAYRPYRDYLPYCVSKAGLVAMTKGLALELAPAVRVNAVAPGPVLLPEDWESHTVRGVVERTPMRRVGSPEDVGRAVLFLVESDFVTGAVVPVDGGRLVHNE